MKAPAGAGLTKRECMLLSGGVFTESLELSPWTGGASSVFWPGAWGSSVAALTGENPLLQPPGRTHAVCTHKAHGALTASFSWPYVAMCYHRL